MISNLPKENIFRRLSGMRYSNEITTVVSIVVQPGIWKLTIRCHLLTAVPIISITCRPIARIVIGGKV